MDIPEESQSTDEYMSPGLETNNFFNVNIPPESSTCIILKLAMDLLLRRLHRRRLLEQQERILNLSNPIQKEGWALIFCALFIHLYRIIQLI